jgi:hypothetical protein
VCAWHDPQRTVLDATVVDVDAHSDQPLEKFTRRLDKVRALLLGPGSQRRMINPGAYGDREILMKSDKPIATACLVEESALNRDC